MTESKRVDVWGERIIRSLPYVILFLAIWRMASIHDNDEVNLAAGLQALFLALAAIFLKLDLRDRSERKREPDAVIHASVVQLKREDIIGGDPADEAADEPLPYKPPAASGGAFASPKTGVPPQRSDATGGKDE